MDHSIVGCTFLSPEQSMQNSLVIFTLLLSQHLFILFTEITFHIIKTTLLQQIERNREINKWTNKNTYKKVINYI